MSEKFVFESAMKRIEEIVRLLEQGDAPLDQSLAFIINVPNGRVITTISQEEMKESIFTNIDGAVIL